MIRYVEKSTGALVFQYDWPNERGSDKLPHPPLIPRAGESVTLLKKHWDVVHLHLDVSSNYLEIQVR